MADRKESAADAETIAACCERGETGVTARQLERWRQAGCLPERERWYEAGTRGSRTANPDGYVDHVAAMPGLMRLGVTLREAPIALFADGYAVDLEVLKDAYCHFLSFLKERLAAMAGKEGPGAYDALEQVDAAARVTAAHVAGTVLGP